MTERWPLVQDHWWVRIPAWGGWAPLPREEFRGREQEAVDEISGREDETEGKAGSRVWGSGAHAQRQDAGAVQGRGRAKHADSLATLALAGP